MTHLTVLGIETSCDETAAAVVRRAGDGRVEVRSSVIASQIAEHRPFGGVVPEIAARAHVEVIDAIVARAMDEAGVGYADLDGVAATAGPGLVGLREASGAEQGRASSAGSWWGSRSARRWRWRGICRWWR